MLNSVQQTSSAGLKSALSLPVIIYYLFIWYRACRPTVNILEHFDFRHIFCWPSWIFENMNKTVFFSVISQYPDHLVVFFGTHWLIFYFTPGAALFQIQNGCWFFFWLYANIIHCRPLFLQTKWTSSMSQWFHSKKNWQPSWFVENNFFITYWELNLNFRPGAALFQISPDCRPTFYILDPILLEKKMDQLTGVALFLI